MMPRIERVGEKQLIGKRLVMSLVKNRTDELWREFMSRRSEVRGAVNQDLISMQIYKPTHFIDFSPSNEFEKWAAVEVNGFVPVPEDMETFVLPAGLYAVFQYKGSSSDNTIFQYIFGTWLPDSAFDLDNRPHFEVLGNKYKNNDLMSEEEIWIPIRHKDGATRRQVDTLSAVIFRKGSGRDLEKLKELAVTGWLQFQTELTGDNWRKLYDSLNSSSTFSELHEKAICIVGTVDGNDIVGMSFLVPSGNPTDIYDKDWSYIRFVTVDPDFRGQGIGRRLTALCIDAARDNGEKVIALHTSELMHDAMRIYESLGFRREREIGPRLGKRYWLYRLDL